MPGTKQVCIYQLSITQPSGRWVGGGDRAGLAELGEGIYAKWFPLGRWGEQVASGTLCED